jgi:hypothetical protein
MDESIDNQWDDMVDQAVVFAAISNSNLLLQMMQSGQQDSDDDEEGDHRQLPRAQSVSSSTKKLSLASTETIWELIHCLERSLI